ncbi:uncharacterized protein G2W53_044471 [Senna tora]|uniref:Uncharacterized protein n=1 Tax=Senna tora TaxID=362788 RepID=A0A834VX27_9FABA|nr:uncharacterized protein G2W53_044471 [Senna tora]
MGAKNDTNIYKKVLTTSHKAYSKKRDVKDEVHN